MFWLLQISISKKKITLKYKFKCGPRIREKFKILSCVNKKAIKIMPTIGYQRIKYSFVAALRLYCKLTKAKLLSHFKYCRGSVWCLLKIFDTTVESESFLGW